MTTLDEKVREMGTGIIVTTIDDIFERASHGPPPPEMVAPVALAIYSGDGEMQRYADGVALSHPGWRYNLSFEGYGSDPREVWDIDPIRSWLRGFFRYGGVAVWERLPESIGVSLSRSQWWTVAFHPELITKSAEGSQWTMIPSIFIRQHLSLQNQRA